MSTSLGRMPEELRRESTHPAICPSSSDQSSKDVRSAIALRSTKPSETILAEAELMGALSALTRSSGYI